MSYPSGPPAPQLGPDGRWWWDGRQWVAVGAPPPPVQRRSTGATVIIVLGVLIGTLMVVGILAAIAIPVFLNQRNKGADAELRTALQQVEVAEESVRTAQGGYSADVDIVTPYVGQLPKTVDVWIVSASADAFCLEARSTTADRALWATEGGITELDCS